MSFLDFLELSTPFSGHFRPQVSPEEETVLATEQNLLILFLTRKKSYIYVASSKSQKVSEHVIWLKNMYLGSNQMMSLLGACQQNTVCVEIL